jgi:hypothetical protein
LLWPARAAMVASLTAVLTFSAWWKTRCSYHHWDGYQYSRFCYNDVEALYDLRQLGADSLPYVERFLEYPVLTGMYTWLVGRVTESKIAFVQANMIGLAAAAVAVFVVLALWVAWDRRLWFWAAGSPLLLYAFYNWDLLAVAFATAGLYAYHRDRPAWAGVLLALGASAKLYPAFFLPILGFDLLRRERGLRRRGWAFGVAAVGTLVAVNLPFAVANLDLWWQTYSFHIGRTPIYETMWWVVGEAGARWDFGWLDWLPRHAGAIGTAGLGAAFVWFGAGVHAGRIHWLPASFAVLLVFLLLNVVYSLQYALWVLPFLVVLRVPPVALALFLIGDVAVHASLFRAFEGDHGGDPWSLVMLAVTVRAAGLVAMLWWCQRQWRPRGAVRSYSDRPPARADAAQAADDGPADDAPPAAARDAPTIAPRDAAAAAGVTVAPSSGSHEESVQYHSTAAPGASTNAPPPTLGDT